MNSLSIVYESSRTCKKRPKLVQQIGEGEGDLIPIPEQAYADIITEDASVLKAETEGLPDILDRRQDQPGPSWVIANGHLGQERSLQVIRGDHAGKDVLHLLDRRILGIIRDRIPGYAVRYG